MNDDQLNVNTVAGSGYLDGYACWSSYGRDFYTKKISTFRSPGVYSNDVNACRVDSDGDVNGFWNINDSYGIILTPRKN